MTFASSRLCMCVCVCVYVLHIHIVTVLHIAASVCFTFFVAYFRARACALPFFVAYFRGRARVCVCFTFFSLPTFEGVADI